MSNNLSSVVEQFGNAKGKLRLDSYPVTLVAKQIGSLRDAKALMRIQFSGLVHQPDQDTDEYFCFAYEKANPPADFDEVQWTFSKPPPGVENLPCIRFGYADYYKYVDEVELAKLIIMDPKIRNHSVKPLKDEPALKHYVQ